MVRIAVVDRDRCRFKDCNKECHKFCPVVRMGSPCIVFGEDGYPVISETLCIGCGICVRKCPFKAITIINLPEEFGEGVVHQYGPNMFRLYRMLVPKMGKVSGLIGPNGAGKSTALKILAGRLKPNLGNYEKPPEWDEIIDYFKGSELQAYFEKLSSGALRVVFKPQYITDIPSIVKGKVSDLLVKSDERGRIDEVKEFLDLQNIWDRKVSNLSGGELQKIAVAAVVLRDADVYIFDEPSSYLDVKERIRIAKLIHGLSEMGRTVVIVEHDLAVLDYLSDYVSVIYGRPGAYGIISLPYSVRNGINIYLDGMIPEENVRFRDEPIRFNVSVTPETAWKSEEVLIEYPSLEKKLDGFVLHTAAGVIHKGEVIGILGPNGIGKTTFVKLLAGVLTPDNTKLEFEGLKVAYKPQYLKADFSGSVRMFLRKVVGSKLEDTSYLASVLRPLGIERLMDQDVTSLSGGELQRVAIAATLGRDADLYLLDEPSAYLDVEERFAMAKVVRRVMKSRGTSAFIVEHDLIVQDLVSDSMIVFYGTPGREGFASEPMDLRTAMNMFLKDVGITFRRDPQTGRPRVNKENSRLDRYQKEIGEYYYVALAESDENEE
ncbi:MAG: ribosome biogenesis/translation initiation ATPase RLI [Candidatus Asgardarchaeia archaeon]